MNLILNIITILVVSLLQITLVPHLTIFGAGFNLPFLFMVSLFLLGRRDFSLLWAGLGGLILDLTSTLRFGFFTLVNLIIYFVLSLILKRKIQAFEFLFIFLYFFILAFLLNLASFIFVARMSFFTVILETIYDGILGFIIYQILKRLIKEESGIPKVQIE